MKTSIDMAQVSEYVPCRRCGFRYRPRKPGLCIDCRYVLDPAEIPLWVDK